MPSNYIDIQSVSDGYERLVKQEMKFKTGKFVWKIQFNIPLNPATVNNNNLRVTGAEGKVLNTKISYNSDENTIEIEPVEPYATGQPYNLHVTKNVESKGGQKLKSEIDIKFQL